MTDRLPLTWCTVAEVPATVAGLILLDGPGFPYVVRTGAAEDRVHGTLITIRPDLPDEVLNRLDALEGVRPGSGLFDRIRVTAVTAARPTVTAWTYTVPTRRLATVLGRHDRIPSGDWLHR